MFELPVKALVFGTPISVTTYDQVCRIIEERPRDEGLVVACCNVHSVMSARRDPALARALRSAQVATPDGMPLVWALRALHGQPLDDRVYGPELMLRVLRHGVARGFRHYLFGATEATLARLEAAIGRVAPGAVVAGREAPPFRALSDDDVAAAAARVREANTDVLWVGLGMPKQELLMPRLREHLPGVAMAGVGAAFDFIAGNVPQAPRWMQDLGLEWAFRLAHEPRRLWRRYLWNNPAYLALFAVAMARRAFGEARANHG